MKLRAPTLRIAALAALLAAAALARDAKAAEADDGPTIVGCRVGFGGEYKAGVWTPIWIDIARLIPEARVEITTIDSDGVPVVVAAGAATIAGKTVSTVLAYVKIGRQDSAVRVALVDGERVLARATFEPGPVAEAGRILPGLPSSSELIVSFGAKPIGLKEAIGNRDADSGELARRVVHLDKLAALPTEWFGYAAVDTFVLSCNDVALCQALAADEVRMAALVKWIELGGRIVVLCGPTAPELLGESSPLAQLVPGRFDQVVELPQTSALEQFASSEVPILTRHSTIDLPVAKLVDVGGRIAAHAGREASDLPLVVRASRGLGELVFAGVDVNEPPLAEWRGRPNLLRALLRLGTPRSEDGLARSTTLATAGYNDLAGALRQRLGQSFLSVKNLSFSLVALLAIGYLLLLGPLDYFVVHKAFGRPMLAWITFPLLVLATSGGAYWLAEANRGARHVNQLELVDIDLAAGTARGTYWATLYSPRSERYDLALDVRLLGQRPAEAAQVLLSNFGLPGAGVGGTQAATRDWEFSGTQYRMADDLSALVGVPIGVSSTKSLTARWLAPVGNLLDSDLEAAPDGTVEGSILNQSGTAWNDALLLHGGWAYRLGNVAEGARVEVGQQLDPIRARALLARQARGRSAAEEDLPGAVFDSSQASLEQLLRAMMFYELIGGYGFAGLPSQFQAFVDLSDQVALGQAVLVARYDGPSSELVAGAADKPLAEAQDPRLVLVRFVFPVEKSTN